MRRKPTETYLLYPCIFCAIILFTGCVRSANPNIERGINKNSQETYSEIRLSALGFLDYDGNTVLQVTTNIVYGSLSFQEVNGRQFAKLNLSFEVINQNTGNSQIVKREFEIESERQNFEIREDLFSYTEDIQVEPGEFSVVLTATDLHSGQKFINQEDAYVPDPSNNRVDLTAVRISGKDLNFDNPLFTPIATYNIPSGLDSLKFDFQVTNNDSEDPLTIEAQLLRFEADLSPSDPMSDNNPSPSEIEFKGIDYYNYTVKEENIRRLDQEGSVLIEFKFPLFENGNYRFEVKTTDGDGDEHYKARDFAIRSEYFPALLSARQLAEPLIYLMSSDEHQKLMKINDAELLKESMDRFWLSNIGSMRRAKLVINLFYERVETANKMYTNFKEGWKTDRGKIYILFGAPWYTDKNMNNINWAYTHNMGDPEYNFTFYRSRLSNEFYPFNHYLLERRIDYHRLEYRQQQLWLTGSIIERKK